ncbi:MAG TPA: hypothetical protein VF088_16525 [Pyrinomonadaceae bacterium]
MSLSAEVVELFDKPETERIPVTSRRLEWLRAHIMSAPVLLAAYFTAFPLIFYRGFWAWIWRAGLSNAHDGSAHNSIARIYDLSIFPDTFGWTQSYFGGMPFPNFYPPLFYWCVALLHHTQLFTFELAFKVMTAWPIILMPPLLWIFAWRLSDKNIFTATWTALLVVWLMTDPRSSGSITWSSGLDYHSTFISGFYTQPLGFVLLVAWFLSYLNAHRKPWRFALACLLLALTVLASFFNAITAAVIVLAMLGSDILRSFRAGDSVERKETHRALIVHLLVPLTAAGLTLFWTVPMLSTYRYFVTLPFNIFPMTPFLWGLYALSILGVVAFARRPTRGMGILLITCFVFATLMILSAIFPPRWFPFQSHRFLATLNFLLTVPAGFGISFLFERLTSIFRRKSAQLRPRARSYPTYALGVFLALFMVVGYAFTRSSLLSSYIELLRVTSFYPIVSANEVAFPEDIELTEQERAPGNLSESGVGAQKKLAQQGAVAVRDVLRFGREHPEGSYLVVFESSQLPTSRAIAQYLGAQGNQTLLAVFREDSPNSLFMYPLVNAFSVEKDSFGISSALADDVGFPKQSLTRHLDRARLLGVRYLVVRGNKMKALLAQESQVLNRYDLGAWSIFELRTEQPPIRALEFRPALVITDFSLKERRRNGRNFIRFAEEQFADGWFDVPLVNLPGARIEDWKQPDDLYGFGAIILDKYDCGDCDITYQRLQDFAQRRPLILLQSDAPLFQKIHSHLGDFPMAEVVERQTSDPGEWMSNIQRGPTFDYSLSPLRSEWAAIRRILETHKVPTQAAGVSGQVDQYKLNINSPQSSEAIPVLLRVSYHPNWLRSDGGALYMASPAFMLAFVHQSVSITYQRRLLDYVGLYISGVTLIALLSLTIWGSVNGLRSIKSRRGR